MGALKKQRDHISYTKNIVDRVLAHFDSQPIGSLLIKKIGTAAELTFSDPLLFEKFELWDQENDDEVFLFHIQRFFKKKDLPQISSNKRDLKNRREEIETKIKSETREHQKKIFAERITLLAVEHGLLTNEQLGEFLGVSTEQARKYRSGENKPQMATLHEISKRFKVSPGHLIGL